MKRLTAAWLVCVASLLSAGVWASARFGSERVPRATMAPAREDVALWRSLEVEPVALASEAWTEPLGSYVQLDETKAARIGVPLAGHVTRVYVELGYDVKVGDPLFSVSGPELCSARRSAEHSSTSLQPRRRWRA